MSKNSFEVEYDEDTGKIESITGKYVDDLDILEIDSIMRNNLREKNPSALDSYINLTVEYIDEYQKIGKKNVVINFGKKKIIDDFVDQDHGNRLMIISRYLFQLSRYTFVNIFHQTPFRNVCPACSKKWKPSNLEDGSIFVCQCGYEKTVYTINDVVNTKSSYQDRANFLKAMYRFQGKIEPEAEELNNIMLLLDKYFESCSLPKGEVIRALPLTKKGRKKGTSSAMMYEALKSIGKPVYEFSNVITARYWGWSLPDLTDYEENIIQIYEKTQRAWEKLANGSCDQSRERKSNLTSQFRLYSILDLLNYPVSKADFRLIQTRNSLIAHCELWNSMCKVAKIEGVRSII